MPGALFYFENAVDDLDASASFKHKQASGRRGEEENLAQGVRGNTGSATTMNLAVKPTSKRSWAAARQAGPPPAPRASEQGLGPRTGTAAPLEGRGGQ